MLGVVSEGLEEKSKPFIFRGHDAARLPVYLRVLFGCIASDTGIQWATKGELVLRLRDPQLVT